MHDDEAARVCLVVRDRFVVCRGMLLRRMRPSTATVDRLLMQVDLTLPSLRAGSF